MDRDKQAKLEKAGWKVGDAEEFLMTDKDRAEFEAWFEEKYKGPDAAFQDRDLAHWYAEWAWQHQQRQIDAMDVQMTLLEQAVDLSKAQLTEARELLGRCRDFPIATVISGKIDKFLSNTDKGK